MVSTYTPNLRLTKQGDNDNPNSWGDIVNEQVTELIEDAISGVATIDVTGSSNIDISSTVVNGGADDARNAVLNLTGVLGADIDLIVPSVDKVYVIDADQTGGFDVRVIPSGGSSGITCSAGETVILYTNGTGIVEVTRFPIPTAESVPTGVIVLWSGTIATIPTGYQICDGTGGTPDLRDTFVVGARQDDAGVAKTNITGSLLQFGGSTTDTTDSAGAHDHGGSTASHTLTLAEIPAHTHNVQYQTSALGGADVGGRVTAVGSDRFPNDPGGLSDSSGGGGGHSHTISSDGDHTHQVDILPPFFALAYIQKV